MQRELPFLFTKITMNRLQTVTIAFAAISVSLSASELMDGSLIPLNVGHWDPTTPNLPVPKSPIQIPLVYQDGNELTFGTPCTGCTLQLLDSTGEVVYETTVASGTTIVNLPSASLLGGSGTYELRLIFGDYYFYGDIYLV